MTWGPDLEEGVGQGDKQVPGEAPSSREGGGGDPGGLAGDRARRSTPEDTPHRDGAGAGCLAHRGIRRSEQ